MEIYAHRGVSGLFPENTLLAFQHAANLPITGIELDVQLSKDGHLVVIHDEKIDRTSTGNGFVKEMTYAQLKQFDFGVKFSKKYKGEQIPLLSEVLDLFVHNEQVIQIELKTNLVRYEGIEEKLLSLIYRFGFEHRVIISSFHHESIKIVRKLAPNVQTALLTMKELKQPLERLHHFHGDGLHISKSIAKSQSIKQVIQQGIPVRVFTVNSRRTVRTLQKIGVVGVFTDFPHKMIDMLKK